MFHFKIRLKSCKQEALGPPAHVQQQQQKEHREREMREQQREKERRELVAATAAAAMAASTTSLSTMMNRAASPETLNKELDKLFNRITADRTTALVASSSDSNTNAANSGASMSAIKAFVANSVSRRADTSSSSSSMMMMNSHHHPSSSSSIVVGGSGSHRNSLAAAPTQYYRPHEEQVRFSFFIFVDFG